MGIIYSSRIEITEDIRELTPHNLEGFDCQMLLAAISNDSVGELDPGLTYSINSLNENSSVHLAKTAKKLVRCDFCFQGAIPFIEKGEKLDLDEPANLNGFSTYAMSKIDGE